MWTLCSLVLKPRVAAGSACEEEGRKASAGSTLGLAHLAISRMVAWAGGTGI